MALVIIGALLVILGIAMAAVRTAERGQLSDPNERAPAQRNTLEPKGRGRRLSLKADAPGLAMAGLGAVLILAGALSWTQPQ